MMESFSAIVRVGINHTANIGDAVLGTSFGCLRVEQGADNVHALILVPSDSRVRLHVTELTARAIILPKSHGVALSPLDSNACADGLEGCGWHVVTEHGPSLSFDIQHADGDAINGLAAANDMVKHAVRTFEKDRIGDVDSLRPGQSHEN